MSHCDLILHALQDGREQWGKNIVADGDCWIWVGSCNRGYAEVKVRGKSTLLHRLFYEAAGGVLVEGHHIHHICGRRNCLNPAHLEQVSKVEHLERHGHQNIREVCERRRSQTHCLRGHEFTPENTRIKLWKGNANRECRTCNRDRMRSRREQVRRQDDPPSPAVAAAEQLSLHVAPRHYDI